MNLQTGKCPGSTPVYHEIALPSSYITELRNAGRTICNLEGEFRPGQLVGGGFGQAFGLLDHQTPSSSSVERPSRGDVVAPHHRLFLTCDDNLVDLIECYGVLRVRSSGKGIECI
jgi:hypothetical protein